MKKTQLRIVVLGLLAVILAFLTYRYSPSKKTAVSTDAVTNAPQTKINEAPAQMQSGAQPPQSAQAIVTVPSTPDTQLISEEVALSSLRKWVKRRDGKNISVLSSQAVNDLNGKPASLNVLVAEDGREVTAEKLKAQLSAISTNETDLKALLKAAYEEKNFEQVNKLVAEFTQNRSQLLATNQVTSFKIALTKERPPVLSFWDGLPFEMVREDAARELAAGRLGPDVSFKECVYYSSEASLLCFTNRSGESVLIDPVNVAEIPRQNLNNRRGPRPSDPERDQRIADQWRDFLTP